MGERPELSIKEFAGLIKANYEALGQTISDAGLALLVVDLQGYPQGDIIQALARCRKECRKITPSEIIDRLPHGHPGAEEAWGIVSQSMNDEGATVVRTEQMALACGVAWELKDDPVAARMAFRESYNAQVLEARRLNHPPVWRVSLGEDKGRREGPLKEAVEKGRLTHAQAQRYLPEMEIGPQHRLESGNGFVRVEEGVKAIIEDLLP